MLAVLAMLATAPPVALATTLVQEIVVTATREPEPSLTLVGNTARIGEDRIDLVGHTHAAELGTQAAGTWLMRGTEQESLPSIRSPVLTGPGSCGAFLMLEDGVPTRPTGFCNVNELFEILTEQSTAMEVVRGPSNALYGANALHGTINFLLPEPGARPGLEASGEVGPNSYWRTKMLWDGEAGGDPLVAGVTVDHDSDFRADAGYRQAKGFVKLDHAISAGSLQLSLAGTVLDQDTAGFIVGPKKAYEDEALRTTNANPGAYRDADSERLGLRWTPAADNVFAGTDFRFYLHRSAMDFLQHFLPGTPREQNGQWSTGLMVTNRRDFTGGNALTSGVDLELARGTLEETQAPTPPPGGTPPPGNIPPGKHYDYVASSFLIAPYGQLAIPFADAWSLQLGLRAEYMLYDYDNRMLDGNTDEHGTRCDPAPCRFNRPADRSDDFLNLAPNAGLLWRLTPALAAYLDLTHGFRPPQATELYRLQAGQDVADLDSETLDSAELGLHWQPGWLRMELATFAMKKRNFIFQDADRFNVSDGRTRHVGVELQADARLDSGLYGGIAGTWSKQTYDFDATTPGGEQIVSGNDIDTAPRTLASARIGLDRAPGIVELEWVNVGDYYLDATNTATYAGHNLFNFRSVWRATDAWSLALRVDNLLDKLYADRADYAFGNYRYFPGREREAYVEVAWRSR
jgi:outer membrane receptor protein involved in Fe transport